MCGYLLKFLSIIPTRIMCGKEVRKMNLGQLSNINEEFINNYKKYGYKTKTQLANEAISLLRQAKAREKRMNW